MWIPGFKGLICGCLDPRSICELFCVFDSKKVLRSLTKFIPENQILLFKNRVFIDVAKTNCWFTFVWCSENSKNGNNTLPQ